MKLNSILFLSIVSFSLAHFIDGAPRPRGQADAEKEYTFPGTGFFIKNRDPYEAEEAKSWFVEAHKLQKEGSLRKALGLYEKFSKRRSDALVNIDGSSFRSDRNLYTGLPLFGKRRETGRRRLST